MTVLATLLGKTGSQDCHNEYRLSCFWTGQDNFCRSQEGHGWQHGRLLWGPGKGSLPVREQSLVPLTSMTEGATAHFLIPLLFPVNCSYLNPWYLPTVHPILLSSLPQERGVSDSGMLNWGIPFLNHITDVQILKDFGHQAFQISFPFSYSWYVCHSMYLISQWQPKERVAFVVAGVWDLWRNCSKIYCLLIWDLCLLYCEQHVHGSVVRSQYFNLLSLKWFLVVSLILLALYSTLCVWEGAPSIMCSIALAISNQ